jgi:small subunit ribosomal protein S6e
MFKINISEKGKTYHLELENEDLHGKKLHDKIEGKDILPTLEGYEMEIAGMSDKAGFPSIEKVEGIMLKKVLLSYEKGMHKKTKREGKKKWSNTNPKGLRLRKTARGSTLSGDIVQINLKVLKSGSKKLAEIFPDQCQPKAKKQDQGLANPINAETA